MDDGYPDEVDGVALYKSGNESGYKGVTSVRLPAPGYRARDGPRTLGTFPTRLQAAVAFARSQLEAREEKHHARKEDRRRGTKRKRGACENAKPEQAAERSHVAADAHYGAAEAKRYTARNSQVQDELAGLCLDLMSCGGPGSRSAGAQRQQLLLDLGCGSGLSAKRIESCGQHWIGVDVAREMLMLANSSSRCAGLIQADLGSLPLRTHAGIDGAISVSTLQWLLEGRSAGGATNTGNSGKPAAEGMSALQRLFAKLHATLRPGANVVCQFYPSNATQGAHALMEAAAGGLDSCELLVGMPHESMPRACKFFLCASKGIRLAGEPPAAPLRRRVRQVRSRSSITQRPPPPPLLSEPVTPSSMYDTV
jgi:SAM-dependent methyltransferase